MHDEHKFLIHTDIPSFDLENNITVDEIEKGIKTFGEAAN